ncbi:putative Tat pathway signal sequence [Seiridium cardinale]
MSASAKKGYSYDQLEDSDKMSSSSAETPELSFKPYMPKKTRSRCIWIIIAAEIVQLLLFSLGVYLILPRRDASFRLPAFDVNGRMHILLYYQLTSESICANLATYSVNIVTDLAKYNTTVSYSNDDTIVESSDFADYFWATYVPYTAIVAVNIDTVREQGIPESAISPTNAHEMIYQVDGFHELHCLYRLRRILLGRATRMDHAHTLHCLNYIRQTLMCNMDFTLGTTENYMDFGLHDKRQCRDYDAIAAWVERNKWKDFENYQFTKYENHKAHLKDHNGTYEVGYKTPY